MSLRQQLRQRAGEQNAIGATIRILISLALVLRNLRWWLPQPQRAAIAVNLNAAQDVQRGEGKQWTVTGPDPQFRLALPGLPRGWVRLSGRFEADAGRCAPRLYIDTGSGFVEHSALSLQPETDPRQTSHALSFYLPLRVRGLRLDPAELSGISLRIEALSLVPVPIRWSELGVIRGLGKILRWLMPQPGTPSGAVAIHLRPQFELSAEPLAGPSAWRASGGDPQFLVDNLADIPSGWVRLSGRCSEGPAGGTPMLYRNTGHGFAEERAIAFAYGGDLKTFSAEFYMPLRVRSLRFDPITRAGRFTLDRLVIEQLPLKEQVVRTATVLLRRVARPLRPLLLRYFPGLLRQQRLDNYEVWLKATEPTDPSIRPAVKAHIETLAWQPLISIVMPTWKTPLRYLREAIESVQAQAYANWQLCIADDASGDAALTAFLSKAAATDPRIRVLFCEKNGGIVAASNAALDLADGDYVAFLDHDDLLTELTLYYVAVALNASPRPEVIYTDEDKIDEKGQRFQPHLKPDWNPELLLSNNYIAHLAVYRRGLVEEVGRLTPGTDGSQDYDLMLRCTARCTHEQVCHIPVVLYHWRAIKGSTALTASAKSYTHLAGQAALRAALSPVPGAVVVDGPYPNMFRVLLPLPVPPPRVSIIIPTRDGYAHLEACLRTLRALTDYPDYELLLVDNQSSDTATLQLLAAEAQKPNTRVLQYDAPFNYSAINNMAAEAATGDLLLLLNDDIEVIEPGWLRELVSWLVRPGTHSTGIVGAKLLYPDRTIQHAGVVVGAGGVAGHAHVGFPADSPGYMGRLWQPQRVSAVTAACLLIRRSLYLELGGLDAQNLAVAFNDVDLCLRAGLAGWHVVWTPYAMLIHHESKSRGSDHAPERRRRFEGEVAWMHARWGERLLHDPYYHRGFSMAVAGYALSAQPLPLQPWLTDRSTPAAGGPPGRAAQEVSNPGVSNPDIPKTESRKTSRRKP